MPSLRARIRGRRAIRGRKTGGALLGLALALAPLANRAAEGPTAPAAGCIIPAPTQLTAAAGVFRLDGRTIIQAEPGPATDSLQAGLSALIGFAPPVAGTPPAQAPSGTIMLELLPSAAESGAASEGYTLALSPGLVAIRAPSAAGLFYGVQSLLQMAAAQATGPGQPVLLPALHLEDQPRFAWRGLMLDESRHFFGKRTVEELLDVMATLKLNRFHWHLTDEPGWRIEIKAYPRLTQVGAIGKLLGGLGPGGILHAGRHQGDRGLRRAPPDHGDSGDRAAGP